MAVVKPPFPGTPIDDPAWEIFFNELYERTGGDLDKVDGATESAATGISKADAAQLTADSATASIAAQATEIDALEADLALRGIPSGGADEQVLAKSSADDYAVEWVDAAGGGGGGASALIDLTDVTNADATNRNALVADGTTFLSRPLVEADISDLRAYSILKAKGNIAGVSFANVENILAWTSSFNTGADVTLGANTVTIDEDGTYKFTVTLRTDSNNRTELFIRTYIDTGTGLTQDTDEIVSDYVSRDADQNTGAVTLATALQLTAGDIVQFRGFGDTDGTCVGLNAGTVLLVERVA